MTDKQKRKIQASRKHLEVAQRALNCVDTDCLFKDPDREYADEMYLQWEKAMYAIDDLIGAFSAELYAAGDSQCKTLDESERAKRDKPHAGEIWRHFKGRQYLILGVAVNATNDGDGKCVVYKNVESADECYVRELDEFMSAVDTRKYPTATQKWRFEKIYDTDNSD